MSKPHFRLGVVAVVRDGAGNVLAFERSDHPDEWQLPQGGVESGESLEVAAWRELQEETGLTAEDVRLAGEYDGWTAYLWPSDLHRRDRMGQVHRWFFFEPVAGDIEPRPDGSEFTGWAWMTPAELIERTIEFRRQPYRQVLGG